MCSGFMVDVYGRGSLVARAELKCAQDLLLLS